MGFVLVTSAYNEADHIHATLDAVVAQFVRPDEWIIVSDGSSDDTDAIIRGYADRYGFIRYHRRDRDGGHSFGSKSRALNEAIGLISADGWDFLGVLDADIAFGPDYFARLLRNFDEDSRLGICGGHVAELHDGELRPQAISLDLTVAGATQMFRRQCWEQIGGFAALPFGGEDAAAEITARSQGWKVRTDPRLPVRHFGFVGRGSGNLFRASLRRGNAYWHLGYHPLFELARCLARLPRRPFVVGSLLELSGYALAAIRREGHLLPPATVAFLRGEQLDRLFARARAR